MYLPTAGFGGDEVGARLVVGTWLVVCLGVVGTIGVVETISSAHSVSAEKGKQSLPNKMKLWDDLPCQSSRERKTQFQVAFFLIKDNKSSETQC